MERAGGAVQGSAPPEDRANEIPALAPHRVQELLRRFRVPHRAGAHRDRRPERLRQVQSRRGAPLGDGRELLQEHARLRHGRRDLLGLRQAADAQHRRSGAAPRQFGPARPRRLQRAPSRSRSPGASSASRARPIASTARKCAPATCNCCSPTPRPAPARPPSSGRARSARSSAPSPRRAASSSKRRPACPGLHSRRHEAELRLKGAEDNLLRVEDVLKQIDAQVESLRRQARQSSRYRNLAADIRRHDGARPSHRMAGA